MPGRMGLSVLWAILFLGPAPVAPLSPHTDAQQVTEDPGVCQSRDIRNTVQMFSLLEGCRVVEGFVQIVLIDNADVSEYANLSFPELREITDFLLLYRVHGLTSIGQIFPNLSVIRGNTLFINYALVAFEMLHLEEVGLTSLTQILRGGVYFRKNPLLCFVDTIDWDLIAPNGKEVHVISANRPKNECPLCPTSNQNSLNQHCAKSKNGEYYCWNLKHCQKDCPSNCSGSCSPQGLCCDPSCLGGCSKNGSENCYACKDVWFDKRCISTCPENTYEYLNWRCLQESECYDMPKPKEMTELQLNANPWKPFQKKCVLHCPHGYLEVEITIMGMTRLQCEPCKGVCKRKCPGANIDSIAAAQKLKGCTSITGALEIQIRGGSNVVKELEESLSTIEEIDDYLKVVRSFPLVSLSFLRSLKEIHGFKLEGSKYALVVLDNQNLIELWNWERRGTDFKINNGKLFFHFNPKLCLSKIERLREITKLEPHTDLEVATNSNGDKVPCDIQPLNATVYEIMPSGALIAWKAFQHYDSRTLLGYVLYTIEAPYRNITLYDERDACGGDGWHVHDIPVAESEKNEVNYTLLGLMPYTQYAFYIKTYTVATEKKGAQSPIIYFRTKPGTPSEPRSLTVEPVSDNVLSISWKPPAKPNGIVISYLVSGSLKKDLPRETDCGSVMERNKNQIPEKPVEESKKITPEKVECDCNVNKQHQIDHIDHQREIDFEDELHNRIYVKRPERKKRDVSGSSAKGADEKNETAVDDGFCKEFSQYVQNTSFERKNLKHYSNYEIVVRACREWEPGENRTTLYNCGTAATTRRRTSKLETADNVDSQYLIAEVSNKSSGVVLLKWNEPAKPNGLISCYQIEYIHTENEKPPSARLRLRVSSEEFRRMGNTVILRNLSPGNYSVRVSSYSSAGFSDYTVDKYFYIEEISSLSVLHILMIAVFGISFILAVVFSMFLYLRRQYSQLPNNKLIATVNPEYVPTVYEPDDWEVPRSRVEIMKDIGQGSFGMVYEGILHSIGDGTPDQRCAVKTVNVQAADRDRIEFLNEASVMKAFNTHHVVKLLGVVSRDQPTLVIMELMANGDLKSYLRSHRPDNSDDVTHLPPPSLKRILRMAAEIADGMAYLSAKKFVHRDLAARNCMVSDDLTVKIGDFGMTRDIYETEYYRKGSKGLLPVRWMAPESLKDGVFTSHSDAWSYGIVLYEMVTLASQPYQGLSNDQVLRYVMDGGVIDRPENCPDKLYNVMRLCWQQKPTSRPTFLELVALLHQDVGSDFQAVSFYDSEEGIELRGVVGSEETPLSITRDIEDFSLSDDDDYKQPRSSSSSKVSNGNTTPYGFAIPTQVVKTTKC